MLVEHASTTLRLADVSVSNPSGGIPVDITHKEVVHLLVLGGPFFITRADSKDMYCGKKYKMYFVDTQAMTAEGDYITCRTSFERLLDANTFIHTLRETEEVQLKTLHELVAPIYLEQGKTPAEEEEERKHQVKLMAEQFRDCLDQQGTTDDLFDIANSWFDTNYIFIIDEINRKYPKPKYREFLRTSDSMENYGRFQREV